MTLGGGTPAFEDFNGKKYPKPTDRELPVSTKDTNPLNYEFARTTQKGGYSGRVYGVSNDSKYWYGGVNGISGSLVLNNVLPEDFNAAATITGTLTTRGFFDPKRIASPVPAV
jgi:hypothetical protein